MRDDQFWTGILYPGWGGGLDLPTSRASKAELGARKIYTMQAKTEREARGKGSKARPSLRGHLQLRRPRRTLGKCRGERTEINGGCTFYQNTLET